MGIGVRYYLFPAEGKPLRLAMRVVNGLIFGNDALPDYAGTRQRVMEVVLDNEDGKPQRIVRTDCHFWSFDDEGRIRASLQEELRDVMESLSLEPSGDPKVVHIGRELSRKRLSAKRWKSEQAQIDQVIADIWPKGGASRLKSAKGVSPKRPPLTWDAKEALKQATKPFWEIGRAIDPLKEPSLKSFIYEARQNIELERENAPLYRAVAEMGEKRLAILRRRRTGKGVWFASVDITRWGPEYGETIATYHERCDGRDAAVEAARRLMIEHAHRFTAETTVDAEIMTDLEWDDIAKHSSEASE